MVGHEDGAGDDSRRIIGGSGGFGLGDFDFNAWVGEGRAICESGQFVCVLQGGLERVCEAAGG